MQLTFTANPMPRPANMSAKAALAWDYFEFGRTWLAVEAANGEIIVTDEAADLNGAQIFPDADSFLEWLEAGSDDQLSGNPKDYLIACGAVKKEIASDAVIASVLASLEAADAQEETKKEEADEADAPGAYHGGAKHGGVDWDYFNRFDAVSGKYLPSYGEGETMATQICTAVNKLVYKWYNDGDVYDNTHILDGWCNDLSSYANWLYANVPETRGILDRIRECYTDADYEILLSDLADYCLTDECISEYADREKTGSIYRCDGPFVFRDSDDDDF